MYKRVLIVISIFTMCATSYALGYATGGSNMGYYYPSFSSYISYDPTYEELGRYVDEGKEYVDNCNADIQRIIDERENAIEEINRQISNFNMSH